MGPPLLRSPGRRAGRHALRLGTALLLAVLGPAQPAMAEQILVDLAGLQWLEGLEECQPRFALANPAALPIAFVTLDYQADIGAVRQSCLVTTTATGFAYEFLCLPLVRAPCEAYRAIRLTRLACHDATGATLACHAELAVGHDPLLTLAPR
jgi:hypothetical protein